MKAIFWIIGLLLLLIVGAGVFLYLNSGALIKTAMESYGPEYLGADVAVDSVALQLTDGTGTIRGLEIGNPAGFEGPRAMRVGEIHIELDPQQISSELVVIRKLRIDGAELAAILKGTKETNFQALLDNVTRATGGSGATADSGSAAPKLIIDAFDFTGARTSLSSNVLGDVALDLPDLHLTNIGRASGGATAAEVVEQILKPITQAISREVINRGVNLDEIKDNVRSKVEEGIRDKLGGGLKKFTEQFGNN